MTSSQSKIHSVKLAEYTPVAASEKEDRGGWVQYGDDNKFPQYLIELSESSPVHGALCISIAQMIAGSELAGMPTNFTIEKRLIENTAQDIKIFGGYYWEIIYTVDRSSAEIKHLPFENCRLGIAGEDEEINSVWYSQDWSNTRKKKNKPRQIFLFEQDSAMYQMSYFAFSNVRGSQYYGKPDYWPSVNWIELNRQIGMYHVNNILNGLFPSFIINFFNGNPEPDEKAALISAWEKKMSGARNAGKFLAFFNEAGVTKPEITQFPISDADKQYQFLSDESTKQVMIGHRATSPLLFGIRDSGGGLGSNSDEIRQAFALFNSQVINPFQEMITDGFKEITGADVTITEFSPFPIIEVGPDGGATDGEDVAAQALNGAQIASMVEILIQAASGILPVESAKAVMAASFPTLLPQQVDDIFSGIVSGSIDPNTIAQTGLSKLITHLQKKKPELSKEAEIAWIEFLMDVGESANPDWIEIDSYDVDYSEEVNLVSTGSARPNSQSKQDKRINGVLYITRYRYDGEVHDNTRPFCRKMIEASKIYRKEDIMGMKDNAVNPGWGPHGADNYSIWLYKGGGNCHHVWKKIVYVSAKDLGIDVNSPNAKQIAVSKAAEAGYKTRNNPKVSQRPIDMPNQGFLPKD